MKLLQLGLTAASLLALAACHKGGPNDSTATTTPISSSAGSYAPNTSNVPGTNGDATGVGATGVSPEEVGNAPSPNTVPSSQEPTAPAAPTP